ncbi:hypothetical protein [Ornithobacterium rhinotracheale]|uniref:hypothetical protein n=1 Tax=Ornithobacterium rhinotracheale TaxID=28251 RepID=UPI00129CC195|nr:hypothetical protein [Ornithobacterium rhinotracheale]MRJ09044.1 hypothetical protein [Ornithobacterium rhinotracheale]MRJ11580.1 hypothetical protein [Ornithobacterium rhinotracheale]UOH77816.1 hypothetical protein MT996_11525 [Ornithobacterium rhinotracheale]
MDLFFLIGLLFIQTAMTLYSIRAFKKSQLEIMQENENYQNILAQHYERGWNRVVDEVINTQKTYVDNLESIIEALKLNDHELYLKVKVNLKINEIRKKAEERILKINEAEETTRFVVEQIQSLEKSKRFEDLINMLNKVKLN